MDQIAQAAEVGRSTLYTFFRDKDELVAAISEDYVEAIAPIIASLPERPSRPDIDRWIADFAAFVLRERAPSLLMIQSSLGKIAPRAIHAFGDRVMTLYAARLPAFEQAMRPGNPLAWAQASAALRELSWALIHHVEKDGSERSAAMLTVAGDLFEKLVNGWDEPPSARSSSRTGSDQMSIVTAGDRRSQDRPGTRSRRRTPGVD